ncbi:hypothetical protein SAMN06265339_0550 [Desulfurobacterium pacificum]|uniref:CpXC domain-containing protein n=1 Tax=Desulfurobacterium pacificum TaxID=240166 RepID=A0ABY1NF09_9BACT|nr:hypothetical protein [Desulfurobacterium pacificum]SMP08057.1 hypothetical protein SAMN06265339_0550 [Desulfurobacterium pacificum]
MEDFVNRNYKYDFSMCSQPIELVADEYDMTEFFERLVGLVEPVSEEGTPVECPYCGVELAVIYPDRLEETGQEIYFGEEDEPFVDFIEMIEELVEEGKFRTAVEVMQRSGECKKCGNTYAALKFVIPTTTNFDTAEELRKFYSEALSKGDKEYYYRELPDVAFVGVRILYNGEELWEIETLPFAYDENIEFTCVFKKLYDIVMAEEV